MLFGDMNYKDKHWLGIKIGEYVSHSLIKDEKKNLLSVDKINALDRVVAASNWYESESKWNRQRIDSILATYCYSSALFLNDVAKWIDARIPLAYKKNYYHDSSKGPAGQVMKVDSNGMNEFGFIYHYHSNEKHSLESDKIPSMKQINFIRSLACKYNYSIINEDFTKSEASRIIDFFLNQYMDEPVGFKKYFQKGL